VLVEVGVVKEFGFGIEILSKKKRMKAVQMKQLLFGFHYLGDGSVLLH
jgi:hypothetical protein